MLYAANSVAQMNTPRGFKGKKSILSQNKGVLHWIFCLFLWGFKGRETPEFLVSSSQINYRP